MRPVTLSRQLLLECAKQRPPDYLPTLLQARLSETAQSVTVDADHPAYKQLLVRHGQRYDWAKIRGAVLPEPPAQPVPREQWPRWANLVAKRAREGESGVGDTLARLYGHLGGNVYKRMRKWLKMPCNCERDQHRLNLMYPL